MEVHHHPDLHHDKKKFKEYLLEFLMIFLAVTMGFFAETIREGMSDRHREKDYIHGLINNVQSDTAQLTGLIARNDSLIRGVDSLLSVSKDKFAAPATQDSMYYYAEQYAFSLHTFQFNDLTLVQLRNAGGYNLIKGDGVADSIARYESLNNAIKLQEKFYVENASQSFNAFNQVFDATLTDSFFHAYAKTNKIPANFDVLITRDKEKVGILRNDYWLFAAIVKGYNNMLRSHREFLTRLIAFLKDN